MYKDYMEYGSNP